MLHNFFDMSNLLFDNNSAYFGGAIFISADLSTNAAVADMTFSSNVASLGAREKHTCWTLKHVMYLAWRICNPLLPGFVIENVSKISPTFVQDRPYIG